MFRVDFPQILVSSAAIFGITVLWYEFNAKIFDTVLDLLSAPFIDDMAVEEERRMIEKEIRRIEKEKEEEAAAAAAAEKTD